MGHRKKPLTIVERAAAEVTKTKIELRIVQEYLDAVLLNLPVGIAILEGPDFRYYRINHRLAEINGLPVADHLDRPLAEVLPDAAPDIIPGLRHVFETGEPILDREFNTRLPKDPDVVRYFKDSFFLIKANGKPRAVGAVVLEITERKQAEEALQRSHAALEQRVMERTAELTQSYTALQHETEERKRVEVALRQQREELAYVLRRATMGELTAALAHELRQPLTAIRVNAQTAKRFMQTDAPDLDEIGAMLDDIIDSNRRAADVIHLMGTQLRKCEVDRNPLDINTVIGEAIGLIQSDAVIKGVVVASDLAEGLPLVSGDRVQLQQVLLNLILNGCEAMEDVPVDERRLVVRTAQQGEKAVCVFIEDTGTGFLGQDVDRFFEPFFTTKPQGLGMGLAINRSIIEEHGGKIWASENPDRGATFQFMLPVAEPAVHRRA